MRRRGPSRFGAGLAGSAALHVVAVGLFVLVEGLGGDPTGYQVYAVEIVSPPPSVAGEPSEPSAPGDPAAEPVPPEAEPEPAEAEPVPAEPEPAPPRPEPREPIQPERPRPEPRREPPRETPPPRAEPKPEPPREEPPAERPGGADQGTRESPPAGRDPEPSSAGGEGLTVRTEGVRCPSAGYCENIVRQVQRFFRRPSESRADRADVCFRIRSDGSVDAGGIRVERVRGSVLFRLRVKEAVEQAGMRQAFGALPGGFGRDELPVCVEVKPSTD